jgi:hypothetical protein
VRRPVVDRTAHEVYRSTDLADSVVEHARDRLEDVANAGTDEGQSEDRDDTDERDDQAVLNQGLAFLITIDTAENARKDVVDQLQENSPFVISFACKAAAFLNACGFPSCSFRTPAAGIPTLRLSGGELNQISSHWSLGDTSIFTRSSPRPLLVNVRYKQVFGRLVMP